MRKLPVPRPSVSFKELPDGGVLYCADTEVYFGVNRVGALVWASLPPTLHDFDELLDRLIEQFPDTPEEDLRSDAQEFVGKLVENGLALT